MITDIRTLCPLLNMARKIPNATTFYVVNQNREDNTDVGIDVEAILGRYQGTSTVTRQYVKAMRQLFFRFINFDTLSEGKNNKLLLIDRDAHVVNEYKNCDFWISRGIVPLYGKID
uniref:Uncharacterized protein n=2 Tax=Clastoptera arizonana TaxID=38151 RepID=A0A1B6C9Q9_9HEMI